ncbi:MAG: extracellular solute-binding protein [Firmicutes bacterium]|nr:extracellular solute-binding protein [Bacillota bacterium]
MKKVLFLFMLIMLAFGIMACGGGKDSTSGGGTNGQGGRALNGDIAGEITVSCFETMMHQTLLEEAAHLFEEKYPGTKVNVETFSAMPEIKTAQQGEMSIAAIEMKDDPAARADYISKVNTALMSGSGADILATDVLPLYKFADNGQLVDLKALMEADSQFNLNDYRTNILDALTYKGGLWYMPLEYSFDYYTYDSTLIGRKEADFGTSSAFSTGQLVDLAVPQFDGSSKIFNMSSYTRGGGGGGSGMISGLYARMLREHYASLVDIEKREAHFIDGGFAQLLDVLKEYEQKGYVSEGISAQIDPDRILKGNNGLPQPTERFYFKPKNNANLQQEFTRNLGRRMNMMMSVGSAMGIEDDDLIAGIAADAQGQIPFTFQHGYAINSASKNQQTAWAFIKFLLSEEMQLSTALNAFFLPLHNEARAQKMELVMSGAFFGGGMGLPGGGGRMQGQGQMRTPGQGQPPGQGETPEQEQPSGQGQPIIQGEPPEQGQDQPTIPVQDLDQVQPSMERQSMELPELDEQMREALTQWQETTEQLSTQINTYTIHDSVIDDMINTEVQYFFDGVKTAQEVATTLQSKVELYLNE